MCADIHDINPNVDKRPLSGTPKRAPRPPGKPNSTSVGANNRLRLSEDRQVRVLSRSAHRSAMREGGHRPPAPAVSVPPMGCR